MYVERTSEKLRQIIRSYKIRPTFYTESTMHKLICKPNDRVVTEDKNNTIYEIDSANSSKFYFGESKWSLKFRSNECKRSAKY